MTENENEKIAEEFKTINVIADGIAKTSIASKSNEKLNRYSNISPFDLNRVVLNEDEFENDYINASYIDVSVDEMLRNILTLLYNIVCISRVITTLRNTLQHKDLNQIRAMTFGV